MVAIKLFGKLGDHISVIETIRLLKLSQLETILLSGADPEIFKGWHSMSATMVGRRRNFQYSDGLKRPKLCQKHKFLAKYFYQHFQIFPIFIYNESLPMKPYKFFKICKCFDKEREKKLTQQSMRTEESESYMFYNMLFFKVL